MSATLTAPTSDERPPKTVCVIAPRSDSPASTTYALSLQDVAFATRTKRPVESASVSPSSS